MKTKLIILLFGGLTLGSLTRGCSKIKSSGNDAPKQEQQDKSKQ